MSLTFAVLLQGVVGIGQDITARLAQEREYSKLIDTANAPIFGVDVQGVRLFRLLSVFILWMRF